MKIEITEEQREELKQLWYGLAEDTCGESIKIMPYVFKAIANRNRGKKPEAEKDFLQLLWHNSDCDISKEDYKTIFAEMVKRLGCYAKTRISADGIFAWLVMQGIRQFAENNYCYPDNEELKQWCFGEALEDKETWFCYDDDEEELTA